MTYSYKGLIAPLIPCMKNDGEYNGLYGAHLIFTKDGIPYLVHTGMLQGRMFAVDTTVTPNMLWIAYSRRAYKLEDGAWVEIDAFPKYTYLTEAENIVWTSYEIRDHYLEESTVFGGAIYAAADAVPVLVSDDNFTLEATYSGDLEVTAWGATGVYVGAQIRANDTGEITDISGEATYTIATGGESYALVNADRQVVVNVDCPLNSIGVEITWDKLPGQTATVPIFKRADTGGEEGGEGGEGGETGSDTEDTVTAEARRASFWKGFGSLVGMYGGTVSVTGEAVAASESGGGTVSTLKSDFWKGAACGAAMYGGGKSGGASGDSGDVGEPVAYLYGADQIRLPGLPEHDAAYTDAVIYRRYTSDLYQLILAKGPIQCKEDGNLYVGIFGTPSNLTADDILHFKIEDGAWVSGYTGGYSSAVLVWTNKDLYYTADAGGGLAVEASAAPVPVYE